MAKNRAAANKFIQKKDNFFKKTGSKFSNPKPHNKNKKETVQPAPSDDSNNFFIKNKPVSSKGSNSQENSESQASKRPFDKKQYRLQKYSKKYQIQQWENRRKKAILHNYYKTVKEDPVDLPKKIYEEYNTDSDEDNEKDKSHEEQSLDTTESVQPENASVNVDKAKKSKPFRKAHEEFQRIKEEKAKQKELYLKQKIERKEAMEANKKKRVEKFKKLNKRNKRGQPIMKDRIEMLLEKIQSSINQS